MVRITGWSAQTGGYVAWDHTFVLNDNGTATVSYVRIDAGTSWWQAEFLGSDGYSASTSSRTSVSVTGNPVSMVNAQITWGETSISFSAQVQQAGYQRGSLELVVDGEPYFSCIPHGQNIACSVPNRTQRGSHAVFLRYLPSESYLANGLSQTWTFTTGAALPPPSGILIDAGALSTPTLAVDLNVGKSNPRIDLVKLSNSPDGLDGASPLPYSPVIGWQLEPGPDGERTVYARFHLSGDTDWLTQVNSDEIFLDTTAPSGSFVINNDDPSIGSPWGDGAGIDADQYLTGWVSDNSLAVSGTITHYAVSTDCHRWIYGTMGPDPATFSATVSMFGESWGDGVADEGGTKTFCVRWRDAAGNWSEPARDSIDFMWHLAVGRALINGSASADVYAPPYVSTTTVDLEIVVDYVPPEGIASIKVYGNNGNPDENQGPNLAVAWPTGATSLTMPWSLTNATYGYSSNDGLRNIAVRFLTNNGRSQWMGGMAILDRAVPTSDMPVPAVAQNTTIFEQPGGDGFGPTALASITTISTDIQWKAADATSGVGGYDLDRLFNGSWTDVQLASPTDTSVRQSVASGTSNQFRVQATDRAGNTSAWKNGPAFNAAITQDNAANLVYSGAWKTVSRGDALGGSIHTAKAQGASVRLTFTGRGIAIVGPRGLSTAVGTANVYIDGKLAKAVFFTASTLQPRRVVFTTSWKSKGTHTIKIVKKYASSTLPIDAFVILT
jgi:hypothetical protein